MKRKVAKLRLSPNEEARVIREELDRRRKLRIQQVREQQRYISLHIRQEVEQRRQRELKQLEEELREDWERQQREKLLSLQRLYQESLQLLGQGHRSAKENEPDLAAIAQREERNHVKAEERYRDALKELKTQRLKDHERQSRSINARRKALQAEKERSAKVASLPLPLPNPIQSIDTKKPHVVKKSDVSAFAATHYHMPESAVDREAGSEQPDAHQGAELESRRLQELQREEERRREEQLEKARLRGKQALRREHLVQDRERLLVELEHMQQTDLLRRRQQMSQMPAQIFQPLYKRQETREEHQREMEFAFEDMYTGERRVKGDLVVQLVPEPLPALSSGSQDQELDVTLDEVSPQAQQDSEQEAGSTEQETSAQAEPSRPAPRRALKKLLDRIRSQRNQWTHSHVSAADLPTTITDQIPERDTTIDTGSLTSEEKDNLTSEPAHSPTEPELEKTEQTTAAETQLPDVFAKRVQEFEEERKKREEELEREKQQQVALLQELEEQKAKLEQMLLEAQQEREDLKAVVTQQREAPVHDQEHTSVPAGEAAELGPPAGEDSHGRRIREYQQRLLEQNRVHQRSVEVARQRLEEYQRALRIRYNMTATLSPPVAAPPVSIPPPLHSAPSVHPPAPPQLPTTPAVDAYSHASSHTPMEVLTRESDRLAAPSQRPVSAGSKLLQDNSIYDRLKNQRQDATAWLTDSIMERVTEHLPERVRPSSEPLSHKRFTTNVPLQPPSDPLEAIRPCIRDGAALISGHAALRPGTLLQGSMQTRSLSPREDDDMERHRRELQEVQRRMLEQQRQQEEERQIRELQEVQRRMLEQQRQQEEERQIRELQEVQRRMLEQREAVTLQQEEERQKKELQKVQRQQEEERQRQQLQDIQVRMLEQQRQQEEERQRKEVQRRMLEQKEAVALQQEEERQRKELQEVQRRMVEQREAVALQQRQQEEERQRQEGEMERMRQQKEMLQALIQTDAQSAPEAESEEPVSENISQTRLALLASLLRAIEESNGGTLSHLEEPQEGDSSPPQPPHNRERDIPSLSLAPAGPAPPSVVPPPRAAKPPLTRVRPGVMELMTEQHELSAIQEVETPVNSSQLTGPEDSEKVPAHPQDWDLQEDSETCDSTLQTPSWSSSRQQPAERLSTSGSGSGRSSQLIWRERLLMGAGSSPESSESGSVLRIISPLSSDSGRGADYSGPAATTESALRPPDSDCLSSTTISTGSYITTDPELNGNPDNSQPLRLEVEKDFLDVSSPSAQSFCSQPSPAAGRPGPSVSSLFNDSSIQHIIDRYTRELNVSLSAAGRTTDGEGSCVEDPDSSVSLVPVWERTAEDGRSAARPSPSSDASAAQSTGPAYAGPALDQVSDEVRSLAEDSFRPLLGQLADMSSCLAADHRDSSMEQLVGQPSAHSSLIGPSARWESTLSRMIGRLSHQSASAWLSGGQDFYAAQLMAPAERSSTWLDLESQMRPLVGELDESAGQHSGSSDEQTRVDLRVSTGTSAPSHPSLRPEASPLSVSVQPQSPRLQDQTMRGQTRPEELDRDRTEVFPGSDSFLPLLAELTHNETTDASLLFHPAPCSSETRPASGRCSASPPSDSSGNRSVESEPSPERFRAEQPSSSSSSSSCSSWGLGVSQCTRTDVELTALSLSNLSVCEGAAVRRTDSEQRGGSAPLQAEQESPLTAPPLCQKILDAAAETGILEQSEITLLSLTDTTDQDTTITEDDPHPGGARDGWDTEDETDETPGEKQQTATDSAMLLEIQWGPSRELQEAQLQEAQQQRRAALLQRSARRVEELRARAALAKIQPKTSAHQPDSQENTKPGPRQKAYTKSKGGPADPHQTAEKPAPMKQRKAQRPATVSVSSLKPVLEVKSCTVEQRKQEVTEMHRRTQRLYEQLEEVKQQKAVRSRQQDSAKNRLKAKEFHQKTLQKLRAKHTLKSL